jgi:pimeloyl-ACP methyl ester carboxylesterase
MKAFLLLPIIFSISLSVMAQLDFQKLKDEFTSRKPALDSMVAYPDVPFDSLKTNNKEGTLISFWWMPRQKSKGTALLVHGFNMNKSRMLARAEVYYTLGYNVIVMDLRARGQSGGQSTTSGPEIRSDVLAVMDYYNNTLKEYGPLVLVGFSHGGRAVVFAAEQNADNVQAIILESIPYSLAESFKRMYKINPPPIPEGDISKAFQALSKLPLLLMIGDKDSAIISSEAEQIKSTFKNQESRVVVFNGAAHDLSVEKYKSLYEQSIKNFMSDTIK